MFCSQCGKPLTSTDRFCGACGTSAAGTARRECPTCRAEIRPGALFCHECGTAFSGGPMTPHALRRVAMSSDAAVEKAAALIDEVKRNTSSGQRVSLSSAILGLILFFLPWADVSCMGVGRTMSGFELASKGSAALWIVPLSIAAVLVVIYRVALARQRMSETPATEHLVVGAGVVAAAAMLITYLTALSQAKRDPIFGDIAGAMIRIRFTGLVALIASIGMTVGGVMHRNTRRALMRAAPPEPAGGVDGATRRPRSMSQLN
jgi:hypothetical protein